MNFGQPSITKFLISFGGSIQRFGTIDKETCEYIQDRTPYGTTNGGSESCLCDIVGITRIGFKMGGFVGRLR